MFEIMQLYILFFIWHRYINLFNILINDRKKTKSASNLKEIATIKIRYDVTNQQDIEEQIALYEKYKKEVTELSYCVIRKNNNKKIKGSWS